MHDIGGFDFSDICDDAVQRSGGEQTTAEDIDKIRRSLKLILERWAAKRYNTWRVKTAAVALLGTPEVTLPAGVDDVFQMNVVNNLGNNFSAGSEATMRRIGPQEYAQLTTKGTKGQPSMWYLDRTIGAPKAFVYPIGREGEYETLVIYYVERPADFDRHGTEVDAPTRWIEALTLCLAHDLARKRPLTSGDDAGRYNEQLIQRLKFEAEEATVLAADNDRQRTRYQFRLGGGRMR